MKKSEFNERPDLVVIEGNVLRINFDIEERTVSVNTEDTNQEETRTLYLAYVVRTSQPLTIDTIKTALLAEDYDGEPMADSTAEAVASEAMLALVNGGYTIGDHLAIARRLLLSRIAAYDVSSHVNIFTYKGVNMWFSSETRNGLVARLNAEKATGKTTTTLWFGTQPFTLSIDDGLSMLTALEVYASECYDQTSAHAAAVTALDDADAILRYDFTTGYPDPLVFK